VNATLIGAIGMKKVPKGTTRGVFVIDKSGKVLAAEAGGPQATVDVVKAVVGKMDGDVDSNGLEKTEKGAENDGKSIAQTTAEVADSAAKVDG